MAVVFGEELTFEKKVGSQGPHSAHLPVCTQHSMPLTAAVPLCVLQVGSTIAILGVFVYSIIDDLLAPKKKKA